MGEYHAGLWLRMSHNTIPLFLVAKSNLCAIFCSYIAYNIPFQDKYMRYLPENRLFFAHNFDFDALIRRFCVEGRMGVFFLSGKRNTVSKRFTGRMGGVLFVRENVYSEWLVSEGYRGATYTGTRTA